MRRSKGVAVVQQQTTTKISVCCRNCEHAKLIQYGNNPVLALCPWKPDYYNQYGMEVDVASSQKYCGMHAEAKGEKEITKLFIVRHHPRACYVTSQTKDSAAQ